MEQKRITSSCRRACEKVRNSVKTCLSTKQPSALSKDLRKSLHSLICDKSASCSSCFWGWFRTNRACLSSKSCTNVSASTAAPLATSPTIERTWASWRRWSWTTSGQLWIRSLNWWIIFCTSTVWASVTLSLSRSFLRCWSSAKIRSNSLPSDIGVLEVQSWRAFILVKRAVCQSK